jgi:hypothetical protein
MTEPEVMWQVRIPPATLNLIINKLARLRLIEEVGVRGGARIYASAVESIKMEFERSTWKYVVRLRDGHESTSMIKEVR